jgi:hypothetical protein
MSRALSNTVTRALRQSRWTPFEARVVLGAVATSGLSPAQFARQYDVDYQRLNAWRRRLTTPAALPATTPVAEAPVQFVELRAPAPTPVAAPRYEILLPSGELLRVEGAIDPAAVGALLTALRGATRPC